MEKIMLIIHLVSLDEVSTTNKNAWKWQPAKISQIINVTAFGTLVDPGSYNLPHGSRTGKIAEVKCDDSRAKDLEDKAYVTNLDQ
jgi:hypothetical protein